MDRLPALIRSSGLVVLLAVALTGCGDEDAIVPEPGAAPPSRVEAVGARREDPAARFCETVGAERAPS